MADRTPSVEPKVKPSSTTSVRPRGKDSESSRASTTAREANRRASEEETDDEEDEEEGDGSNFISRFFADSASWMTSLVIHMVAIIILALSFFSLPAPISTSLSALQSEEVNEELE